MARARDAGVVRVGRELVPRPRLVERLCARWEHPLVVVRGAAGFGKTSLLHQAVGQNLVAPRGVDRMVECERGDDAWVSLAGGILAALDAAEARPAGVADAVTAIRNAMTRWSPTPVCLVVDDVHLVPEGSSGAELLRAVVDALPAGGHLLLAGRHEPPVPLARLAVGGGLVVVDEQELAFNDQELSAFAASRGIDVDGLGERARWPALAEIEAVARQHRNGALAPSGRDFVWQEVLAALPQSHVRALAVLTTVVGGDQEVLDVALGAIGDQPVEATALLRLPLVSPMDGWLSPHPLWAEHVGDVLTASERDAVRQAVGHELLRRERHDLAFEMFSALCDVDGELATVRQATVASAAPVPAEIVRRWADALRASTAGAPELLLLDAIQAKAEDQEPDRARDLFEQAARGFRSAGELDSELACYVHLMQLSIWTGDTSGQLAIIERVVELEGRGHRVAAIVASVGRLVHRRWTGDLVGALDEVRSMDLSSVHESWRALIQCVWSNLELNLMNYEEALALAQAARPHLGTEFVAMACSAEAYAYWAMDRWTELAVAAEDLLRVAARAGRRQPLDLARAMVAFVSAMRGDVDRAGDLLALVGPGATPYTALSAKLAAAEAALALHVGDSATAVAALRSDVSRFPIERGWGTRCTSAPLYYVLLPETRAVWDGDVLPPAYAPSLDNARALLDVRAGSMGAAALAMAVGPERLIGHLPGPWVIELAVAAVCAGALAEEDVLAVVEDRPGWLHLLVDHPVPEVADRARSLVSVLPAPPEQPVEVRLFGEISIAAGGSSESAVRRARVRELVTLLVLRRQVTREQVLTTLWPDLDRTAAANNLRVTVSHLRKALEPERAAGAAPFVLRLHHGALRLAPAPWVRVDVWEFEAAVQRGLAADRDGDLDGAAAAFTEATNWYRGDLAPHADLEWAVGAGYALRDQFTRAALRAGEIRLAQGEPSEAAVLARRVLEVDLYDERAHRLLASAQLAAGQRTAARATMERCLAALQELGVGPEPATTIVRRSL